MSLPMTQRVWADESLSNTADRLVMLALADCHNPKRGCFPSLKTLLKKTQLSKPGLVHVIDRLIKNGYVRKSRGGGRGNPNGYLLYPDSGFGFVSETVNTVNPLYAEKGLTPCRERVNASTYKGLTPCKEMVNAANPFSLGKTENPTPPNGNRTVIGTVTGADALSFPSDFFKAETKPKSRKKPFQRPTMQDFIDYGLSKGISRQDCIDQFEIWDAGDWHDGNGTPIQNWKQKLLTQKTIANLPSHKRAKANPISRPTSRIDPETGLPRL
jgi:hypothetical protein